MEEKIEVNIMGIVATIPIIFTSIFSSIPEPDTLVHFPVKLRDKQ